MTLDATLRAEVDEVFRGDAPDRLARLQEALERLANGAGEEARAAAAFEAHALRGAAAIVGRTALADLCAKVEDAVAAGDGRVEDLHALAARVRRERESIAAVGRRTRDRLVPRRFMTRLSLILALTLLPAFGVAAYNTFHAAGQSEHLVRRDAVADSALAAEGVRQLVSGAHAELDAAGSGAAVLAHAPLACDALLAGVVSSSRTYAAFEIVRGGRLLCGSTGATAALAPGDRVFRAADASGALAIGELRRDRTGTWVVPFAAPVAGVARTTIATVVPVSAFAAVVSSVRLDASASVTVFDRRSRIVVRLPDPTGRYTGLRGGAVPALQPSAGTKEVRGIDGVRRLYAYEPVGPWYVAIGRPLAAAQRHLLHTLLITLLVMAALGVAGIVAGLVVARRTLWRPLASLVRTARRLGDGDLAARTDPGVRGAELAELAAALDGMADRLARRTAERERAAAELQELAAELERRVDERTAALEEAWSASERLSEAKSGFLARLSHELRTPLNAIRGFSQLLATDTLTGDQAEAARHVLAASEHMTRLVDELLDTARIEAGEFRVERTVVRVGALIEEIRQLEQRTADDGGIALSVRDVPDVAVEADPVRLRQVLLNLVSNAIAYNRPGGRVILAAQAVGDHVDLEVADTGQGIAPEHLDRLFVAYDRLDRGFESSGLGLGLALSKRLVEAMGGSIGVESVVGEGTRFVVSLPRAELAPPPAPHANGARAGSRTVLYVDDNATNVRLVELLVRSRGATVVGAASAAEGIARAETSSPGLILLDLDLPDGSGEDLLHRFRGDERFRAVPIVIVSGDASRDTARRLLEAGADEYLTKPIEVDRAAALIERLLGR